ncbi:MAG: AAA family ATPase [Gammaproteobacteria bacterium]|nr:AAA family ATPase [Gammaproteobacteria bacterium]MDE0509613.1 AAA family ATPase [Gammaproteobacteria bacterium]MXX07975.1 ATP-binding protein [Gammaproteobacteria bacterium]MYC59953.1 ATP-binding protein [Gammaproteobacteria bacterium]MYE30079.1 ATP-binding protein [Gammaproteobacteria bacterium]
MPEALKRQEISHLKDWLGQPGRKPLVIRGARQVGKSTLVRELSKSVDTPLVTANLERNPELSAAFKPNDPRQILSMLELLTGRSIEPGKTLLFIDEIQASPDALASLRYFHEELPNLRVVAAGSLMELALTDTRFSMPVGRVEYMHLAPMTFEDFVEAVGDAKLARLLREISLADLDSALPEPIHRKCLDLLAQYWVVGGLPEAVAHYVKSVADDASALSRVHRAQQSIVATYRDDFAKYSHGRARDRTQTVFDALPGMVGRKFKYAQVSREHRAAELADALSRLCMARVAHKVLHSASNGLPLAAEANLRFFKCLYLDVGLMCSALGLNLLDLGGTDMTLVNGGAVAEQFVGQQLLFGGAPYETPQLFYWARETPNASAEVDYVTVSGNVVVPIEVKAGSSGSLRSLHRFLKEKRRNFALRFNTDRPSLLQDTKKLTDGTPVEYRLLSLPLYLAGQSRRLIAESLA